ncbi:MAG TPA: polyprenyl synthetase family protein [Phycisphaerae bacterium]|nr:polyprenyl synthetase family protein [Phycisphaerae bacterium]HNU46563.1 polyprenyl synthetase family protein [Phycisphaerae bacterium]
MAPTTSQLDLTSAYAPVRRDLDVVVRLFDAEVTADLPFVNELVATVRSYRGKMLRPALLLLAGKATGTITATHHTLGAVVELVHMATLVHDDVLDEATERRRHPTIAALAGNTAAVLLGDFLISHAFHLCSSLNDQYASRRIGATTNTVCEGEMLQDWQQGNFALTEAEYLDIIRRKTAVLTATCCALGARYAGASQAQIDALESFGLAVGVAFQIVDDVLDIAGNEHTIGKTLGLDLDLGKATLPLIHFLREAESSDRAAMLRRLKVRAERTGEYLRGRLEDSGSLLYALQEAERYVRQAQCRLDLLPASDARSSLLALADFVVQRQF